nr:MAG TPA: hypothetical protein [Caudoviricetes sp.]
MVALVQVVLLTLAAILAPGVRMADSRYSTRKN